MYNQTDGVVLNKPVALIGKAIEQRSQILDGNVYRDYLSVAEALANLTGESAEHTAAIRSGHAPVYVTPLGEGTKVYWFLNGTQDADLVEMTGSEPQGTPNLQQVTDEGNTTTGSLNADSINATMEVKTQQILVDAIAGLTQPTNLVIAAHINAYFDLQVQGNMQLTGIANFLSSLVVAQNINVSEGDLTVSSGNLLVTSGNIGIGIDPTEKLEVEGVIKSSVGFMFPDNTLQITAAPTDLTGFVQSTTIDTIVALTQSAYDLTDPKLSTTLYFII